MVRVEDNVAVSLISEATKTLQHMDEKKAEPFLTLPSLSLACQAV
jgi:hypothetical protein